MHEEPHVINLTTGRITGYQEPCATALNMLPILQTVVRVVHTLVDARIGTVLFAIRYQTPEAEFADIADSAERAM